MMLALVRVMGASFQRVHVALSGWIVKENGIMGRRMVSRNFEAGVTLSLGYPNSGSPDVSN